MTVNPAAGDSQGETAGVGRGDGPAPDEPAFIELRGVWLRFGHVTALQGADLSLWRGEVLALVGDNGAGKSSLVNVIAGVYRPDEGQMLIHGRPVRCSSPKDSQMLGIQSVFQDLAEALDLTPVENIFLGRETAVRGWLGRIGVISRRAMLLEADSALRELHIALPSLQIPVRQLSGGQRQAVAVARAVKWATSAVLMDEPTASLGARQTQIVFDTMRAAAAHGLGVLLISHDIPTVLRVADRIAVMRHGRVVGTSPASSMDLEQVMHLMLGGA